MARQGNEGERVGEEAAEFAFCHQREALANETDFTFFSETAEVTPEDT